jgi:hypothetical protein
VRGARACGVRRAIAPAAPRGGRGVPHPHHARGVELIGRADLAIQWLLQPGPPLHQPSIRSRCARPERRSRRALAAAYGHSGRRQRLRSAPLPCLARRSFLEASLSSGAHLERGQLVAQMIPWRAGACPQADRAPLRAREDSPAARSGKPMRGWVFVAALPRNGQVKETWTAQEARCGQQQHPPSGAKRTRCGGAGVRRVLGRLGPRVCGGGGGGSRRERRRGSSQSGVARPSFPTSSKSDDLTGPQLGGGCTREFVTCWSVRWNSSHRLTNCLPTLCQAD